MADLEQQLRELSKERFESFVHQYLVANYPNAGIQRVDGSGGYAGIDSFSGTLASGPTTALHRRLILRSGWHVAPRPEHRTAEFR
jgi:hypothetical protein